MLIGRYLELLLITQLILWLAFKFGNKQFLSFHAILEFSPIFAGFLVIGALCTLATTWTWLTRLFTLRAIGSRSNRAAKIKGFE
jgi:magnesium-transporting ATPase (P-type)